MAFDPLTFPNVIIRRASKALSDPTDYQKRPFTVRGPSGKEDDIKVISTEYRTRAASTAQWSSFLTATTLQLSAPPVDLSPLPEYDYSTLRPRDVPEEDFISLSPTPSQASVRTASEEDTESTTSEDMSPLPSLDSSDLSLPDFNPPPTPVWRRRSIPSHSDSKARHPGRSRSPPPPPPVPRYRSLLDDFEEDPDEVPGPLPKNYDRDSDPLIKKNTEINQIIAEWTTDLAREESERPRPSRSQGPVVGFGEVVIKSESGEWEAPLLPAHDEPRTAKKMLRLASSKSLADRVVPRKSSTGSMQRKRSVAEKSILKNRENQSSAAMGPMIPGTTGNTPAVHPNASKLSAAPEPTPPQSFTDTPPQPYIPRPAEPSPPETPPQHAKTPVEPVPNPDPVAPAPAADDISAVRDRAVRPSPHPVQPHRDPKETVLSEPLPISTTDSTPSPTQPPPAPEPARLTREDRIKAKWRIFRMKCRRLKDIVLRKER